MSRMPSRRALEDARQAEEKSIIDPASVLGLIDAELVYMSLYDIAELIVRLRLDLERYEGL